MKQTPFSETEIQDLVRSVLDRLELLQNLHSNDEDIENEIERLDDLIIKLENL